MYVKFIENMHREEKKWTYEKLRPWLCKPLTDNAQRTENTTPEQRPTSTKEVVERIREPASKKTWSDIGPVFDKVELQVHIYVYISRATRASADHARAYPELITPTIHWFTLATLGSGSLVEILKTCGNCRLAPFDPVWSHPLSERCCCKQRWQKKLCKKDAYWTAAAKLQMMTVR